MMALHAPLDEIAPAMLASCDDSPRVRRSIRPAKSVSREMYRSAQGGGKTAQLAAAVQFAVGEAAKHDPSQPMTLRIALLTVLAWIGTGSMSDPVQFQRARDFLADEADARRASSPADAAQIDQLLASMGPSDVGRALDCVLALTGVERITDI